MTAFGLEVVVINSDTCAEAREVNRDLWIETRNKGSIIVLSPEELRNPEFRRLIDHPDFSERICKLGIDEIHLLHWWGKSFRPAFQEVGFLRPRLPSFRGRNISLIGTTATLREGRISNHICNQLLGLKPGSYHRIRRSNMRHDIQLIFREMRSGIGGTSFPELDWIVDEGRSTVIFCKTISLGFRVVCYLWRQAKSKGIPDLGKQLRLFNSLNWHSYNQETLSFLNNNNLAAVTIATDVLSVGWDSQVTEDAIILGEPPDVDEFVQKIGRVGRNRQVISHPRGILYYTRGALATAQSLLNNVPLSSSSNDAAALNMEAQSSTNSSYSKKGNRDMDVSMARLLLAKCKPTEIDSLNDNPEYDLECNCTMCRMHPPIKRPATCNCSGTNCRPESVLPTPDISTSIPVTNGLQKPKVKRGEMITKELRALGTVELESLRQKIFRMASTVEYGFFPPSAFLTDEMIKEIINKLYSLKTISDIRLLVQGNRLLDNWQLELLEFCERLRKKFAEYREEVKQKKKEKKKEQAKEQAIQVDEEEHPEHGSGPGTDSDEDVVIDNVITDVETGEVEEIQMQHLQAERPRITWRINMRYTFHSSSQLKFSNGSSVMQQLESLTRHLHCTSTSPRRWSTLKECLQDWKSSYLPPVLMSQLMQG
jgi:hypothetical protein